MARPYPGRGTEAGLGAADGALSQTCVFRSRHKDEKEGHAGTSDVYYVLILEIQGHEALASSIEEEENPEP